MTFIIYLNNMKPKNKDIYKNIHSTLFTQCDRRGDRSARSITATVASCRQSIIGYKSDTQPFLNKTSLQTLDKLMRTI